VAPRLRRIEGPLLDQHYWLGVGDECWFLREYVPGAGFRHGSTNDLISNLKRPRGASRAALGHKARAIRQVARELAAALDEPRWRGWVLAPMPPSVLPWEDGYDERMDRVCRRVGRALGNEVAELLVANETVEAASRGGRRMSPAELGDWIDVDEEVVAPWPEQVLVVDDVVTSGAHFVAARRALEGRFPGVRVAGVFVARVVRDKVAG
jgi:predicted amidophosphoribosyltransferase